MLSVEAVLSAAARLYLLLSIRADQRHQDAVFVPPLRLVRRQDLDAFTSAEAVAQQLYLLLVKRDDCDLLFVHPASQKRLGSLWNHRQ